MSKVRPENFIHVSGWMVTDFGLKGNELLIYAIIYGFTQTEDQKFTGSQQYLADWLGSSKRAVRRNLDALIDRGLIVKEEANVNGVKYCSYCTKLNDTQRYSTVMDGNVPSGDNMSPGWGQYVPGGGDNMSPNNKERNNRDIKERESKEKEFDQFWAAYPRKINKQDARRAFEKAEVDIDTLLSSLERHKRSKQWSESNGKYIPHPATYLNKQKWEDELEEQKENWESVWDEA